jgi:phage gp36-like protein
MSYCTQSDLEEQISENELIQLTDDAGAGAVDATVVSRAIADADAEIDAYAGARYDVPFASTPAIIRKISVDIAVYNLFARRRGAPDDRKDRYKNSIRFLEDLSRGLISIGASAPAASDDSGPEATTDKSDRVFTRGKISDGSGGSLDNF